jgi:flagellar biosynthesis/type III secretory pathway ATPase
VGEYEEGSDSEADEAIRRYSAMKQFLKQGLNDYYSMDDVRNEIRSIIND